MLDHSELNTHPTTVGLCIIGLCPIGHSTIGLCTAFAELSIEVDSIQDTLSIAMNPLGICTVGIPLRH